MKIGNIATRVFQEKAEVTTSSHKFMVLECRI